MNSSELLSKNPYRLHLKLMGLPKATNNLLGHHYFTKHNNAVKWKQLVALVVGYKKPEVKLQKVKLTLIRHSWRMLDFDGCVASFKPVVDGLVNCGIMVDDRYSVTGDWIVTQKFRSKKDGSFLELFIDEAV